MAFSELQMKLLKAKLQRRYVKIREASGTAISYVEGWHSIAEANRIFSFDNWDRQTLSPQCHWAKQQGGETVCFYSTKVRITVRAGDTVTVREGIGTGFGRSPQPEIAHDVALKSAETDATKRALATFGNPFGLALYDRDQAHVTKPRQPVMAEKKPDLPSLTFILIDSDGNDTRFADSEAFVAATLCQIDSLNSIDSLYAFWSRNSAEFGKLRIGTDDQADGPARRLADALRERARQIGPIQLANSEAATGATTSMPGGQQIGRYLIPKERRVRDPAHLAFVASEPCLICGRRPAQAHHLRFAQPRAMSLKVSDEYTVPLCNIHHDQLHRNGNERAFWARHGFTEPLKHAARFWEVSRRQRVDAAPNQNFDPDLEQEFNEPYLQKSSGPAP